MPALGIFFPKILGSGQFGDRLGIYEVFRATLEILFYFSCLFLCLRPQTFVEGGILSSSQISGKNQEKSQLLRRQLITCFSYFFSLGGQHNILLT